VGPVHKHHMCFMLATSHWDALAGENEDDNDDDCVHAV
jgi:hypothetical protein